jgi:hypothetical protein
MIVRADGAGLAMLGYLLEAARLEAEQVARSGDDQRSSAPATETVAATSLMITRQQRALLRERGWSDEQIRDMTPADAHRHLGM